jgi:CyaY protein
VELQNGVLQVVFDDPAPAKFVISPNAPVRQVWVSAMARSYKLSWDDGVGAFALGAEALPQLLDRLTREFLHSATR